MKIERYTCDICGAPIDKIENLEEVQINCEADKFFETFTYHVCPYCAAVVKDLDDKKIQEAFLEQVKNIIEKQKCINQ